MKDTLKNKFVELGSKVTLIRNIDKLKKDNQIISFIENIVNSDTFNHEMEIKHGGKAKWKFDPYDDNYRTKSDKDGFYLDGLPMGITPVSGVFYHTYKKVEKYYFKRNWLSTIIRFLSHPQSKFVVEETSWEISDSDLVDKAKIKMDEAIEKLRSDLITYKENVKLYYQDLSIKKELKKNSSFIKTKELTVDVKIKEYVLFYKNLYVILTKDEVKELLLRLELKSLSNVSEELMRM